MNTNVATITIPPTPIDVMLGKVTEATRLAAEIRTDPQGHMREMLWCMRLVQRLIPDPPMLAQQMANAHVGNPVDPVVATVDVLDLLRLSALLSAFTARLTREVTAADLSAIMARTKEDAGDGSSA